MPSGCTVSQIPESQKPLINTAVFDNYEYFDSLNPGSPMFRGVICKGCGFKTMEPDEDDRCPGCSLVTCKSCGEQHAKSTMHNYAGREICTGCYQYEIA